MQLNPGRYYTIYYLLNFTLIFFFSKDRDRSSLSILLLAYKPIRATMYDSVSIWKNNFKHFPEDLKMRYLLSDMNASIANYIVSSLELRKFLITKHKKAV